MSAKSNKNCYNSDRKHYVKGTQCDQPETALWGIKKAHAHSELKH